MGLLKEPRYEKSHDANMRLGMTYVFYKGKPIFVLGITNGMMLGYRYLNEYGDQVDDTVDCNDEDLDISSPRLGYINYRFSGMMNASVYPMRRPLRRQSQGFATRNAEFFFPGRRLQMMTNSSYQKTPEILRMLGGKYPDIHEAVSLCPREDTGGAAFDRCFSLANTKDQYVKIVNYKTESIGYLSTTDKVIRTVKDCIPVILRDLTGKTFGYEVAPISV